VEEKLAKKRKLRELKSTLLAKASSEALVDESFHTKSATLINDKYYKGHSQAGKSKIKVMAMLRVGKWGGVCALVCLCASI